MPDSWPPAHSIQGIIIFYQPDTGQGYVRIPDTREEFYFRRQHLKGPVQRGDVVQFIIRQNKQGYYADQIERLSIA